MLKNNFFKILAAMVGFTICTVFATSCNNSTTNNADASATKTDSTDKDGFTQIFDGKTFNGWEGDTSVWRIDSGSFIGEVTPTKQIKTNTFLIWRAQKPSDFEFKAEYRISAGGNSGVQYRSEELKDIPFAVKGYQADIDGANQYTGQNYEERSRGFLAMRGQKAKLETNQKPIIIDSVGNSDSLKAHIKVNDWNEIYIVAKGNDMKHYINGILMSETIDNDTVNRKFEGIIGLQVHVLPEMKVEYRNIRYKKD
ncbi:MAG TPA: DUF1080 domain-containing protein [Puia sp.]|nr:DUF1080 domain-containing protein [Puia sp.]